MIKLLQYLIFGHAHKWKSVSRHNLTEEGGGIGVRYILQCEQCGKVKKTDLI